MFEDHIMVTVLSLGVPESLWCSVCCETKDAARSHEKDTFHIGMLESDSADGNWHRGDFVQLLMRGAMEPMVCLP